MDGIIKQDIALQLLQKNKMKIKSIIKISLFLLYYLTSHLVFLMSKDIG